MAQSPVRYPLFSPYFLGLMVEILVFLQMLEYYEGILFLTTNRLEHIDNAFQSRINLAYEYPKLNQAQRREIWKNFIQALPESDERAKDQLKAQLKNLEVLDLNGRQIRNVMFTARSLAHNDNGTGQFSYVHVKQIVDHTKKLQDFFERGKEQVTERFGETASKAPVAWDD
jgi:AAA+ superfamily predicted ATPase